MSPPAPLLKIIKSAKKLASVCVCESECVCVAEHIWVQSAHPHPDVCFHALQPNAHLDTVSSQTQRKGGGAPLQNNNKILNTHTISQIHVRGALYFHGHGWCPFKVINRYCVCGLVEMVVFCKVQYVIGYSPGSLSLSALLGEVRWDSRGRDG